MTLFQDDSPEYFAPGPPPGTLTDPENLIDYFDGPPDANPYWFLSNFAPTPFEASVGGFPWTEFPTGEAAFQAAKATHEADFWRIAAMKNPHEAKAAGQARDLPLRRDWNYVKVGVMRDVLRGKFHPQRQPENCAMLLSTGDATLSEGTLWRDEVWGVDLTTGKGQNLLGSLLQVRRAELRLGLIRPYEEVNWAKVRHPYRVLEGQQLFEHLRHQHGYYAEGSPGSEVREWEAHLTAHGISHPDDGQGRDVDRLASLFQTGEWLDLLERRQGVLVFERKPDGVHAVVEVACEVEPPHTHGTTFRCERGKDANSVAMAQAGNRLRKALRDHKAGKDVPPWN